MGQKWLQACARASGPKTTKIAPHGLYRGIGLSQGCVRLGDEGPSGVWIVLCTRAVPIRAELAAASARLGPERAAETLLGAQKRLGMAQKHTRNGCTVPSHPPLTLDNRSCHGVGWGVGCGGRALWSVGRPLSERRGPFFSAPYFGHRFLFRPKHQYFPMFRGTWYLICHLIGKTLWYEVLVTTGTSL